MNQVLRRKDQQVNWSRVVTVLLWAVVGVWLIATLVVAVSQTWGYDVRFFWASARTFLDGGDPLVRFYAYPGVNLSGHTQFVGLPWVTLLTVPFALLPFNVGATAWTIFNIGLLCVILGAVYVLGRKSLASWQLALIILCSFWLCLRCLVMGQIGLLVTTAALLGVVSLRNEKWLLSGLCFSLTLFKPWVAIGVVLAVLLLVIAQRKWRFVVGLLLGGFGILALTTAVWPQWLTSLSHVDFAFAYGVKVNGNYIVYWPVATVPDFMKYVLGWTVDASSLLVSRLLLISVMAALGLLAVQRWWVRKADVLLLIATGTLLSALIVPYIRFYDYTILSLWVVGVFVGGKRSGVSSVTLGIAASFLCLAFILNLGTHPEPWVYQILFWMYLANAIILWNLPPALNRDAPTRASTDLAEAGMK